MQIRKVLPFLCIPVGVFLWLSGNDSAGQESPVAVSDQHVATPYLLVSGPFSSADEGVAKKDQDKKVQSEQRPLSKFMQQKLNNSNRILKGLMIDDLKMVEEGAEKLLKMSNQEQWRASNDMMYLQHSTQFRNAVDDLRQKAAKKNPDGAALAWVNVTMSCIQCHQWVRNMILADVREPAKLPR